jgi:S1-C subfamily serine protease
MSVGNPYGLNDSMSSGIVSATGRNMTLPSDQITIMYANMIQTDSQVNLGNSGGGLYNAKGDLIGINTLLLSDDSNSDSLGYAIPIDFVRPIAERLIAGQPAAHASLGVSISDVPDDAVKKYGLLDDHGAYVTNVTPSGPAETSGIVANDIISEYNGKRVSNAQDLLYKIRSSVINDQAQVKVMREGREMSFTVKIGSDV